MTKSTSPKKSATIRDVARLAGVSVATISRYLNGNTPLAPDTAERVCRAMQDLNYSPDLAAQNLATRRTRNIGFLTASMKGLYMTALLEGIENAVQSAGYNLLVSTYSSIDEPEAPIFPLGRHNVDGLLIFTGTLNQQELQTLYEQSLPLVLIHQTPPEGMMIPSVTLENRRAACEVVEHLIVRHACRKILFVSGPEEQQDALQRRLGYEDALHKHDIKLESDWVIPGGFDRSIAADSMRDFLKRNMPVQAVFAADDESAAGVYRAIIEAGLSIPEDIRVIGFDDQIFSTYLSPALSTAQAPTEMAGRVAVEKLLNWIRSQEVEKPVILAAQPVYRRSCGC